MAINEAGLLNIAEMIENNWIYHSILDNEGNEIVQLDPSDVRTEWTHQAGSTTVELSTTIYGDDTEITLPQVIAGSEIYYNGTDPVDTKYLDESFELEQESDEYTLRHQFEIT